MRAGTEKVSPVPVGAAQIRPDQRHTSLILMLQKIGIVIELGHSPSPEFLCPDF